LLAHTQTDQLSCCGGSIPQVEQYEQVSPTVEQAFAFIAELHNATLPSRDASAETAASRVMPASWASMLASGAAPAAMPSMAASAVDPVAAPPPPPKPDPPVPPVTPPVVVPVPAPVAVPEEVLADPLVPGPPGPPPVVKLSFGGSGCGLRVHAPRHKAKATVPTKKADRTHSS